MKKVFFLSLLTMMSIAISSCSDDNNDEGGVEKAAGSFILTATSEDGGTYLLQTDDLTKGELTIVNNGLETATGTNWVFLGKKYAYRLVYNQGNAGTGSSYEVDANGVVKERGTLFEITNRYSTFGTYGKYVLTGAGVTIGETSSVTPATQKGFTFTILDSENQTLSTNTISTENFLGNGEYATFVGFAEANGKIYTAVCPGGVSDYGVSQGYASAATTETAYPDSVWVAVFDGINFQNPTIIRDSRLSAAYGSYRSMRHSNIIADDKNNIYVFSSCADANTTKPSGVLRINAGTNKFDESFYFNIENASDGLPLFRAWHIQGDIFMVQLYDSNARDRDKASKFAVFNAASKSFTFVTGLPDPATVVNVPTVTPYIEGGLFYYSLTVDGQKPAIYIMNTATATATKGTVVTSSGVTSLGKLTYEGK